MKRLACWTQGVLIAAGISALVYCGFFLIEEKLFQADQSRSLDEYLRYASPRFPKLGDVRSAGLLSPAPRLSVIGRLAVPSVHLSVMVVEGQDARALALGAGHIMGTALPGECGNVGIAGHRDKAFRALRHISRSDRITFTTLHGTYVYQVRSIRVVGPNDVSVLSPSSGPSLTLVTCYPFYYVGAAATRFVVQARRVNR